MERQMKRRTAAIAALLLPLVVPGYATSPVPPEPPSLMQLVLNARMVIVGTPVKFYFKGQLIEIPEEYERIFEEPGKGRSLYAIIRVDRVLKNETDQTLSKTLRVSAPILSKEYVALSDKERKRQKIFLLNGNYTDHTAEGTFSTYTPAFGNPLDMDALNEVRRAIAYQMGKTN